MPFLLDVPPEILEQIFLELDPLDVGAISQTCTSIYGLIYGPSNELFWKKLYLVMPLDDPRQCIDPLGNHIIAEDVRWRESLQRIIYARSVVKLPDADYSPADKLAAAQTLIELASNTIPLSDIKSDDISMNLIWVGSMLREGVFLEKTLWATSEEQIQTVAHLRALYGLTTEDFEQEKKIDSLCTVYSMRNYTHENDYGPFLKDGTDRVDWLIIRAIQHTMLMHIVPLPIRFIGGSGYISSPMSLPFCSSVMERDISLDAIDDWAGVEGNWRCAYCFCDHRTLLNLNNYSPSLQNLGGPLKREILEDPDFREEFTLTRFSFHITDTEYDEGHPTRPIIHFTGTSYASDATMQGQVKVTSEGHIRWNFVSNHTWSSEGIQVGSVRSAYGVLGIWTTVDHDGSDPVGPFWLDKIADSELGPQPQ